MGNAALLNVVLWLPLAGAAALLLLPRRSDAMVRGLSLAVMLLQLALAAWLYGQFDAATAGLQFETRLPWIPGWGVNYQIGLDGYNLLHFHCL